MQTGGPGWARGYMHALPHSFYSGAERRVARRVANAFVAIAVQAGWVRSAKIVHRSTRHERQNCDEPVQAVGFVLPKSFRRLTKVPPSPRL